MMSNTKNNPDPDNRPSFLSHIASSVREDITNPSFPIKRFLSKDFWLYLLQIQLPEGVQRQVLKLVFASIGAFFLSLMLAFVMKQPIFLAGILLSIAFLILAISHILHYDEGKIQEIQVICLSVKYKKMQKVTHLTFCTKDEIPTYYDFYYPGNSNDLFQVDRMYTIYYDEQNPLKIIGHTGL